MMVLDSCNHSAKVWRKVCELVGTTESVIRNHRWSTFDKLGVWSRLELTMCIARHAGKGWHEASAHHRPRSAGFSSVVGRSPG
jgi:hypothetical protein